MEHEDLDLILSSRVRLRIADMIARRPRTLSELSEETGITVQGVLKHLGVLERLGAVKKLKVSGREMRVRRVYAAGEQKVRDFSMGDLVIVRVLPAKLPSETPEADLDIEASAEDITLLRFKVTDQSRRLLRAIDDLVSEQENMNRAIERKSAGTTEELILKTIFDDENLATTEGVLIRHYGVRGGRRSIDKALAEAKRFADK